MQPSDDYGSILDFLCQKTAAKKIFITGASGFFGRSLIDILTNTQIANRSSTELHVLSRNKNLRFTSSPHIKIHNGDMRYFKFPDEKFDYVIHLASPSHIVTHINSENDITETIIKSTERILQLAEHCKTEVVLFTSSGAAYKYNTAYGIAKKAAEDLGIDAAKKCNFQFKIARCFSFIGPYIDLETPFAASSFINEALSKKTITLSGHPQTVRSYLYTDDLVVWLLKIMLDGKNSEVYDVGSHIPVTMAELADKVASFTGATVNPVSSAALTQTPSTYLPFSKKTQEELKLKVWTTLEEALRKTIKAKFSNSISKL